MYCTQHIHPTHYAELRAQSRHKLGAMHRRMEDKVRDLCEKAVAEKDSAKLHHILLELRDVLHQQIGRIRTKVFSRPLATERRNRLPGNSKNS